MTPDEWRDKVGRHVEARRLELGLRSGRAAAKQAGVSEAIWRQIESGKRQPMKGVVVAPTPMDSTMNAIAYGLQWRDDAIHLLLEGKTPQKAWDVREPGTNEFPSSDAWRGEVSGTIEIIRDRLEVIEATLDDTVAMVDRIASQLGITDDDEEVAQLVLAADSKRPADDETFDALSEAGKAAAAQARQGGRPPRPREKG